MGSKTKTTQQQSGTTTNTYGYMTRPETADTRALRAAVSTGEADPSIAYSFAGAREQQENSYKNPLGAYTTPAVRDAVNRGASKRLAMDERVAGDISQRAAQDQRFGQLSHIDQVTGPQMVQTGGSSTGTGTSTQSYNPGIGSYISQGAGAAVGIL